METEKILYSINQVKEKLDSYGILYYDLPGADSTIQLGGKGECDTAIHYQEDGYVCYATDEDYDNIVYSLRDNDITVGLNFENKSKDMAIREISAGKTKWQGKIVTVFQGNIILNPSGVMEYQPHCIYAYGNEAFDELLKLLVQGRSEMGMTKLDAVWVGAAILVYNINQEKPDWGLNDVSFTQENIIKITKKILGVDISSTLVSINATADADNPHKNCAYLSKVEDGKLRLSYINEYDKVKEHPELSEMKDNITITTNSGNITIQNLYDFIEDVYTRRMINLLKNIMPINSGKKGESNMNKQTKYDKNLILYGPPGTGKTYNSVNYAVGICEGKPLKEIQRENYADVLKRFEELKKSGRVAFTTFHQSYGYEEFIEGIKPQTDKQTGNISYEIVDGVFKRFCDENGKSADSYQAFENAWNKMVGIIEEDKVKFRFTRRSGTVIEAIYLNDDRFRVEWNGGTYNDLTKRAIFKQWSNVGIARENFTGGNKWLFDAQLAIIDEMKKYGLPEYTEKLGQACVFIIDEINRGNISKIFGELITLIEDTKRKGCTEEMKAVLPYSHTEFSVPENIYILGTMNTADRSIALMDTALRRRFFFEEMMPNSKILDYLGVGIIKDGETILNVSAMLDVINRRIEYLYDREHTIGHAFFTKLKEAPDIETLATIFKKNVIPLLQEYFYEDYTKIQYVLGDNQKESSLKFILDESLDIKNIFNGVPDIDLPEKRYRIQEEAFYNIFAYKGIGKTL